MTVTENSVVVSGLGHISAAGVGIEQAWAQMEDEPPVPEAVELPAPFEGEPITAYRTPFYEVTDLGVSERSLRFLAPQLAASPDLKDLVGATALALSDAGLANNLADHDPPVAVVAANESPGFGELAQKLVQSAGTPHEGSPHDTYAEFAPDFFQLNTFLLPHYIARIFGFRGTSLYVNSACTSGLNALEVAAQEVRSGRSNTAIVAAADDPMSFAKHNWFSDLGLYSAEGLIRPFDLNQQGTLFGPGAGAFVLENKDHALQRGATIYCDYVGAAFGQDGWKITVPSPLRGTSRKAIGALFERSGVRPDDIDLVMPHGVGTPVSDQYEAAELTALFGSTQSRTRFTAMKPMFGHNLGGSALLEATVLVAALAKSRIPPTLNHETPLRRNALRIVTDWENRELEYGLKMSCGFAGYHGAALFQRASEGS